MRWNNIYIAAVFVVSGPGLLKGDFADERPLGLKKTQCLGRGGGIHTPHICYFQLCSELLAVTCLPDVCRVTLGLVYLATKLNKHKWCLGNTNTLTRKLALLLDIYPIHPSARCRWIWTETQGGEHPRWGAPSVESIFGSILHCFSLNSCDTCDSKYPLLKGMF